MADKKQRHILRTILLIIGGIFAVSVLLAIFVPEKYRDPQAAAASPKTEKHKNMLISKRLREASIMNGAGQKIGTRAYIDLSRADVESATLADFTDFYKSFKDKGYNWVTIFYNDGSGGVSFSGKGVSIPIAEFRTILDEDGSISTGDVTKILFYDDELDIFVDVGVDDE
jgi:hypothetical protein